MIPNALLLGFVAGALAQRIRPLAVAVLALSAAWAGVIALTTAESATDVALAFWLAVANALVGVGIGRVLRLCVDGLDRAIHALRA